MSPLSAKTKTLRDRPNAGCGMTVAGRLSHTLRSSLGPADSTAINDMVVNTQIGCWWLFGVGRVMLLRINSLLAAPAAPAPPPPSNRASDIHRQYHSSTVRRGGACEIICIVLVACVSRAHTFVITSFPNDSVFIPCWSWSREKRHRSR